ncbi:MAG: hypothetical protein LBU88_04565 [Treponema sp.]|jgi:hypothetical protein|nr:hypothetical protein [Treponema sp.]
MVRKTLLYLLFSAFLTLIALTFTSCPSPTDIQGFLSDEKVQKVNENNNNDSDTDNGLGVPELELDDGSPLKKGEIVTIPLGSSNSIKVTNSDIFSSITWLWNSILLDSGDTLDTSLHNMFEIKGAYLINLETILEIDGLLHSTFFTIEVTD